MLVPIDEVVHFDVITSDPATGDAIDADSTPTFAVYEESTDTDIGVGGNLTKRTSLTGNYRGSFTASAANGFEAGKWYSVIASATVDTIAGKAVAMSFRCVPAEAAAGVPKVDMSHLNGGSQSAIDLQDFADAGYDPSTNKVQGVVLVDTTTTTTTATNVTTVNGLASNVITAASLASDAGTELGTAVWATTTRLLTAGTNIALAKGTGVTGFNDLSAAQVNAEVDTALSDYDGPTKTELDTAQASIESDIAALNDLSAADIRTAVGLASANLDTQLAALPTAGENADAVWDEAIAGHNTSGSTGEALAAAQSAGDPWLTDLSTYGSGEAGYLVYTNLDAKVSEAGGGSGGSTLIITVSEYYVTTGEDLSQFRIETVNPSTQVPTTYDDMTLELFINGVADATVVTFTEIAEGTIELVGTLPTITPSDRLSIKATSVTADVADEVVWMGLCPTDTADIVDAVEDAIDAALADGSITVVVQSPISNRDGRLTIAAGDDYTDESGNAFNVTISGTLPSLSGATFALTLRPKDYPDATPIVGTATLTSQVGSTTVIKCEITRTETANGREYASTHWWYDLQATLGDGTVRTLKGPQAPCTVLLDQSQG